MTTLKEIIYGKRTREDSFNPDEVRPFFCSLRVDIDSIGFPNMEHYNCGNEGDRRWIHFSNITAKPERFREITGVVITGDYMTQAKVSGLKDGTGLTLPSSPQYYSFRIENGKLNLFQKSE